MRARGNLKRRNQVPRAMADRENGSKMSPAISILGERVWELPPLILHPFNERVEPSTLLQSSKASLMLSGLIPDEGVDREGLKRRLLLGRYAEMRMLFYLGKDVFRWLDQCLEWAQREPELAAMEIRRPSLRSC